MSVKTVDQLIEDVIRREGPYVNHPADRGGPTNWGITKATLEAFYGFKVTDLEVKALTQAEAKLIYLNRYFYGPKIDKLPQLIQAQVLDIAVNSGPQQAVKLLQKVVGVPQDGKIGPFTLAAVRASMMDANGDPDGDTDIVNNALAVERLKFYARLVRKKPSQSAFIEGWVNRACEFIRTSPSTGRVGAR